MAIPDYFQRNAIAAAQAISGLDEERLAEKLASVCIGVTLGRDAAAGEGAALTDLLIRLLARLYPNLSIRGESGDVVYQARQLAARINPAVEFVEQPTIEVVIGDTELSPKAHRLFVGSSAWSATISTRGVQRCGPSMMPFGAGAAACLAAANVFRYVFLPEPALDDEATLELLPAETVGTGDPHIVRDLGEVVLAGVGAIGNAAAWALARVDMVGTVVLVDCETIDLGNLQRYVLAERTHEHASKVRTAANYFTGAMKADPRDVNLAAFLEARGHRVDRLLLALDSARDRRVGQASLPQWIANAWTQPGDLGVSTHDFLGGACVHCLYLPSHKLPNEDELIAGTFGVPDRVMQVRELLHRGAGAPRDLLEGIAAANEVSLDRLLPFEGRPLRALYTEGFCGGAVVPLGRVGRPRGDVHVPLAHQSALAGVLLAAAVVGHALGAPAQSTITQIDVLKPVPHAPRRPAAKDPRNICICQDPDYQRVYRAKYTPPTTQAEPGAPVSQSD